MGRPPCRWDDETFANQGNVTYGTAPLAQWDPAYLHLASAVHVPSAAMIDTAIAGGKNLKMLGPYAAGDAGVESIRCRKTVYVPAPYVGLLLSSDLTLSARETDLEEYIPQDAALLPQISALLLRHAQIRWSNWLASQWGKTSEVPFLNLAGLWTAMENQEP